MDGFETRMDGFDGRLRNVEIEFGKVDQRLLTIERVVLPAREQLSRKPTTRARGRAARCARPRLAGSAAVDAAACR